MIDVTINGSPYKVPENNETPSWGQELSDLLLALVDNANNTSTIGDVSTTSFTISDSAVLASVVGVSLDPATIRGAIGSYSIYRTATGPAVELSETGHLYIAYKSAAGTFEVSQVAVGNARCIFSVTNGGQLQILPEVIGGTVGTSKLSISLKVFRQ